VQGWIFQPTDKSFPPTVRFLDGQGGTVGIAITGQPRPDLVAAIDKGALLAGYRGYLLASQVGATLMIRGESAVRPSCSMRGIFSTGQPIVLN
jgi:hypothetical protein